MGVERKAAPARAGRQQAVRTAPAVRSRPRPAGSAPARPEPGASAAPVAVRYVKVGYESAGQRLDNFLIRLSKGVPKSHIYRVVRSGEVRINRSRAAADQRLSLGDEIRIPPMRISSRVEVPPPSASRLPVVFEDEHLLVVDKPAGMAVHGGSGISFGAIERIRAARPNQPYLELAHRLDRDTSGLLLLAKSRKALLNLHAALRQGQIQKRYLVLVAGHWVNDRQHVKLALSRSSEGLAGKVRVDPEGGSASHTVFELRERFKQFALLDAELLTGRTHQIRVHLAHLGFPIVGDAKYGDFELNRQVARGVFGERLRRMFLHASQVRLQHPISAEPIAFTSPLPSECEALVEALRGA
jgi:23S rRNA pseudouridine955/2504/2580 synthase